MARPPVVSGYRPGPAPGRNTTRFVARAYNRLAAAYDRQRRRNRWIGHRPLLSRLVRAVPFGGRVLDLGCGAGVPVARLLVKHGYRVTGIDISRAMLARARKAVPTARFFRRDMARPGLPPKSFEGAIAMYSFFHVPWKRQPMVLRAVRRLLVPGGVFLFNLGIEEHREYTEEYMGTRMYWSTAPIPETLRMIRRSGFRLLWHRPLAISGERHYYFLAQAPRVRRTIPQQP